jgi:hypothetical protein
MASISSLALILNSLNLLFYWIVSDNRLSQFVPAPNTVLSTLNFYPMCDAYPVYYKESAYSRVYAALSAFKYIVLVGWVDAASTGGPPRGA